MSAQAAGSWGSRRSGRLHACEVTCACSVIDCLGREMKQLIPEWFHCIFHGVVLGRGGKTSVMCLFLEHLRNTQVGVWKCLKGTGKLADSSWKNCEKYLFGVVFSSKFLYRILKKKTLIT